MQSHIAFPGARRSAGAYARIPRDRDRNWRKFCASRLSLVDAIINASILLLYFYGKKQKNNVFIDETN